MLEVACPHCQTRVTVAAELQGHTVTCTACQLPFQAPALPTPTQFPLPPHLATPPTAHSPTAHSPTAHSPTAHSPTAHSSALPPEGEQSPNARPQQRGQLALVACWLLLLGLTIAALSYFNPLKLRRSKQPPAPTLKTYEEIVIDPAESEPRWSERADVWLVLHRRKVRLRTIQYGTVRTKNSTNAVQISDRKYLQFHLRIMNATTDKPTYTSWFQLGKASTAQLTDDLGRHYPIAMLAEARRVQGHTSTASMTPLKPIDDVLLFELPADVQLSDIRYLRLTLPAAAWGDDGELRFQISRNRIQTAS